jgi:GTP-binding protein
VQEAVEFERSVDGIDLEPIADLTEIGQEFVLCKGGSPGKGNWNFKTATNRTPVEHTLGTPGEVSVFYLELRRIADAGLVGFPNAGKSTLLGKLSHAKPKVASYPFTTLQPVVGVVEFPGYRRCTVADIPGLIEGAHENRGLGHEFLRHITRCRVLLFVIDMAGSEGRDPISDLEILRREIKEYDDELARFPWKIIANKMDLEGATENLAIFRSRFPKVDIIPISAESETGLDDLRQALDNEIGYRPDK